MKRTLLFQLILVEFCEDQVFITSPSGAQTNQHWRQPLNQLFFTDPSLTCFRFQGFIFSHLHFPFCRPNSALLLSTDKEST